MQYGHILVDVGKSEKLGNGLVRYTQIVYACLGLFDKKHIFPVCLGIADTPLLSASRIPLFWRIFVGSSYNQPQVSAIAFAIAGNVLLLALALAA